MRRLATAVLVAAACGAPSGPTAAPTPAPTGVTATPAPAPASSPAPDFSIERLDGQGTFRLSELRGHAPVVVNFWAPW